MQFGQSACMFRISYSFKYRQYRRYIADTSASALKSGNDDITTFLRPLKVHRCWSYVRLYIRSHGHKILYAIIPAICSERYSSLVADVRNRYYYQFLQLEMINKTKN
jgi:hypothetical protein